MPTKWNSKRIEQLAARCKAGDSAAKIAVFFGGGVTRAAVMGAIKRNKLKLKRNQGSHPGPRSGARANSGLATAVIRKAKGIGAPETNPKPFVCQALPAVEQRRVPLLELGPRQCRWTDDKDTPFLFCGRATTGGAWCTDHHLIVYPPRVARAPITEDHKAKIAASARRRYAAARAQV